MKKLIKKLALIGIVASGVGGIVSGAYPVIGICLGVVGLLGAVYDYFSNEKKSQFIDQYLETLNLLLARSGHVSPYTEIVKSEFEKKGYCKDAIPYLRKALDSNPFDVEAMELYVIIMSLEFSFRQWVKNITYGVKDKDWVYVYNIAERGNKNYPENHVFLDAMGILLDVAGKHENARKMFRKSSKLRTDPYWHVLISTSYGMSGRPDLALKELESAMNKGLYGWIVEYYCASVQNDLGNYDMALSHIQKSIQLGGRIPQLYSIKEECLYAHGRLVASAGSKIKLACLILFINPKRSLGRLIGALVHFVIMIIVLFSKRIWPVTSHIPIIKNLQYKYISPIEPEYTVGCEMIKRGHFKQGLKLFEKCYKLWKKDIAVIMNLSGCYARTGDKDMAIKLIDEGLKLEPMNKALLHNREQYQLNIPLKGIVLVDKNGDSYERFELKP